MLVVEYQTFRSLIFLLNFVQIVNLSFFKKKIIQNWLYYFHTRSTYDFIARFQCSHKTEVHSQNKKSKNDNTHKIFSQQNIEQKKDRILIVTTKHKNRAATTMTYQQLNRNENSILRISEKLCTITTIIDSIFTLFFSGIHSVTVFSDETIEKSRR